jgi:3,4-dihydroxy 2-butanone 4-phosphate synthase/GTP cyclohydrolase II
MARLPDLLKFAAAHNLKIGTIADLIAYRRRSEKLVTRIVESTISTRFAGDWQCIAYQQSPGYAEHIALVKNTVGVKRPTLVRMHALDILHDVLGDVSHGRAGVLQEAMRMIDAEGAGVLVLLREPRRTAASDGLKLKRGEGPGTPTLRDYGIGAQILLDLGVRDMILLSNSRRSIVGLEGYGLDIVGHKSIDVRVR